MAKATGALCDRGIVRDWTRDRELFLADGNRVAFVATKAEHVGRALDLLGWPEDRLYAERIAQRDTTMCRDLLTTSRNVTAQQRFWWTMRASPQAREPEMHLGFRGPPWMNGRGSLMPRVCVHSRPAQPIEKDNNCIVLAATNEHMSQRLALLIGRPDWTADVSLKFAEARRDIMELIESAIEAWTITREADQAVSELQAARIAAAPARLAIDLLRDRHLRSRGYLREVDGAFIGSHPQPSMPFREGERPHVTVPRRRRLDSITVRRERTWLDPMFAL